MKVAVVSDIHGNMNALDAALDQIEREHVDQIICAGDVPNPFLRSLDVWERLKTLQIPVIRGNHEDYIVSYFAGDRPEIQNSPQFLPIRGVAEHLGPKVAHEFAGLPFEYVVPGPKSATRPGENDLYICHASPHHNARSFIKGVDPAMAPSFTPIRARTIVAGHIHNQWSGQWQGRDLHICGSVGLPHHGQTEAQYAILTHTSSHGWRCEMKLAPYDAQAALKEYVNSGAVAQGGPIARMLYEELRCAEPRLALFLPQMHKKTADALSLEGWASAVDEYLSGLKRP